MGKVKVLMIRLSEAEYEALTKRKGKLSWRRILMKCILDKAWRLEEAYWHAERIGEIIQDREFTRKLKKEITERLLKG